MGAWHVHHGNNVKIYDTETKIDVDKIDKIELKKIILNEKKNF